jgi:hypothetical protein
VLRGIRGIKSQTSPDIISIVLLFDIFYNYSSIMDE